MIQKDVFENEVDENNKDFNIYLCCFAEYKNIKNNHLN